MALGRDLQARRAAREPPTLATAIGLFELRLSIDAERLLGWSTTTLPTVLLVDHGGKPNRRVGTLQGPSNLEVVQNSARLYATAIEHTYASGPSVLVGLYDLKLGVLRPRLRAS